MRMRSAAVSIIAVAIAAALMPPAFAQQIFVANSSNGRITVFDASTGAPSPFPGDTSSLVRPLGIALDGAGRLVVADNQRGRIVRYEADGSGPTVLASHLRRPDGPSFSPGGDLFFVDSSEGGSKSKDREVFVLAGGVGPLMLVGALADARVLRETAVVPAGPFFGDLLVLSQDPPFIARFRAAGPGSYSREADFVSPLPGEATGMAFTSLGDLLVSGIGGSIWRYDEAGNRLADFASGLGVGPTRIAVGLDGTVYVTNRNHPTLLRFDASGTRLSDFGGTLQSPAGVAIPALTPTPAGRNVTVFPLPGVSVTFDNVFQAGFTTGAPTLLPPGERLTPCGNVIPEIAALPAGALQFEVILLETTALYTDTIEVAVDYPDEESRLFHAPCPPVAGEGFRDVTTLATPDDPRGRVPRFSEFVVVTDTRAGSRVVEIKLSRLWDSLDDDSDAAIWVDPTTLGSLRSSFARAADFLAADQDEAAIQELQDFKAFVRQSSGTAIPNDPGGPGGNIAGDLVSLAATLIFSISVGLG